MQHGACPPAGRRASIVGVNPPETHYAKSGEVNIAYQVVGDGPLDLVHVPGYVSNLEEVWEEPHAREVPGTARVVLAADPVRQARHRTLRPGADHGHLPTLEQRMDDLRAVMDAAGSERAAVFGHSEGGVMACCSPRRTRSARPRSSHSARLPNGSGRPTIRGHPRPTERELDYADVERSWGQEVDLDVYAPSMARRSSVPERGSSGTSGGRKSPGRARPPEDEHAGRHPQRASRRPGADARDEPHGRSRRERGEARYIAAASPARSSLKLPGADHTLWVGDAWAAGRDRGVPDRRPKRSGTRSSARDRAVHRHRRFDRTSGGARRPGLEQLVERHHAAVRTELGRFRGREVDTAGDGFLATFDGPARAVRCACASVEAVRELGLEIRAGVHTGEVEVAGGTRIRGLAVHIGARVAGLAGAGEVLVSSTVKDLVAGSGIEFSERGSHELKGVPGEWQLFAVTRRPDR